MDALRDVGPVLALDAVGLPLRSSDIFGRSCPLEVEIGAGKGRFLIEWAAAHPEIGLIGVEQARKYMDLAGLRAVRRGLANVRVVHTTAEDLLFRCLGPDSLAGLHVYFPDPWPKKRHHKRRFFRPANTARAAQVLRPGGLFRIKTDHAGYAEVIAEVMRATPGLVEVDVEDAFRDIPATSFEVKYEQENRRVHRFAFRRPEDGR